MEDPQREIEREIERLTDRPPRKRNRRGTLLFVGGKGEVRKIERFTGLALATILLLAGAALAAASLYLIARRPMAENRRLSDALTQVQRENRRLRDEKELLLARLVVLQEKMRGSQESAAAEKSSTASEKADTAPARVAKAAGTQETPAVSKPENVPAAAGAQGPDAPEKRSEPAAPKPVAVEDLVFSRDRQAGQLAVKFKILNAGPESEPVSGRTFVVIETEDPAKAPLTIPRVPLENGRPVKITSGRYFSIARFNTVTFKTKDPGEPYRFRGATVFVFALSGELLLERHFPLPKKAS